MERSKLTGRAEALASELGVDGESFPSTRKRRQSDIESSSTSVRTGRFLVANDSAIPRQSVGVPSEYAEVGEASTRLWRSLHKVEMVSAE
jgi:hypothetical protein